MSDNSIPKLALIRKDAALQKQVAARMLARAMTAILDVESPHRDGVVEMFCEEENTLHAELRKMLAEYAGVPDQWLLEKTSDDIDLALEFHADEESGFASILPEGEHPEKRFEKFRNWLFEIATNDLRDATVVTIH